MSRTRAASVLVASLSTLLLAAAPARPVEPAAQPAKPPAKSEKRAAGKAAVDPAAIAALNRMGAFLRAQPTFAVRSESTVDEILESGQKIQFAEVVEMWVRRPNGMRVNIVSDRKQRQFFYNGQTFTLYGPTNGFYASFAAPPTVRELIDVLEARYQIEMPLVDLFYWGTEKSGVDEIKRAIDVGPSRVGDVLCDHYALQQKDVDWQIWIERGQRSLPRKVVITSKREQGQPQFTAVLGWNLRPTVDQESFTFRPPKGAMRITIEQARAVRASGK